MALLEVRELVKQYPRVRAVAGVSFEIEAGKCFGLLGPNGAGKTTTIEMIEGITEPTSGEILFRGENARGRLRESCGIQFQETSLQDYLSVREVLEMFAALYPRKGYLARIAQLCAIEEFLDQDAHELSGGQRQRLLLAVALVNDPELVFLDEPTTGLDPQARRGFWELIGELKRQGRTVVLTTHYMEEAYRLCDEIAIMDRGKIIARGAPGALLRQYFDTVTVELPASDVVGDPAKLPWSSVARDGLLEITTADVNATVARLLSDGAKLTHLRIRERTLEDLFIALTGKELRA